MAFASNVIQVFACEFAGGVVASKFKFLLQTEASFVKSDLPGCGVFVLLAKKGLANGRTKRL